MVFGILMWVVVAAALIWAVVKAGVFSGAGDGRSVAAPPAPGQSAAPAATPVGPTGSGSSPAAPSTPPPAPAVFAPSPSQSATTEMSNEAPTEVQQPAVRDAPSTFGRIMTWIAIAFAGLVLLSIAGIVSFGVTALFGAIPAAIAVVLCGVGVVWLALSDRPQIPDFGSRRRL